MYDGAGDTFGFTHEIVQHTGANLLFGSLDYDFGPDGHAQADYNAAMMLVPGDNERRVQIYRKVHLVPFGEYVPARALFGAIIGDKVSCANTGVTAFVNRDGRVTQILRGADGSVFGRGILAGVVPVPANPGFTFYTRHGEAFSAACAVVMALGWFFAAWRFLRRVTIPWKARRDAATIP